MPADVDPSSSDTEASDAESSDAAAIDPPGLRIEGRSGRYVRLAGWTLIGIVALGVVWIVVTGLLARSQLNAAKSDINDLRRAVVAGDTQRAQRLVQDIRTRTERADALTSGPAWWVGANLPVLGSPLRMGRTIAHQADRLGNDVLPAVVKVAQNLSAGKSASSSVDLNVLADLAPNLKRATDTARSITGVIEGSDDSWLPLVGSARQSLLTQLSRINGELGGADRAVQLVVPMLGQHTTQRYFVGFLNEAEARGGGGIPGAFAIVTATQGHLTFERFGSDDDLKDVRAAVELGPELDARYSSNDPTSVIQNSNLSPDFSVAGRIWAGMWEAKTGEHVDGAIAVDPTALSYLLAVTGPATLPDGQTVSADTIVALTQRLQYARFPGVSATANAERKKYLTGMAKAISTNLTTGGNRPALVKAVSRAAGQRRLTVWSAVPALEEQLRAARWAGALGNTTGAPYGGFVVNNAAGSKLDYYLRRTMTYTRSDCSAGGQAVATISLTNGAPNSGLPPYVTYRADQDPPSTVRPGDNKVLLTYYASQDAAIVGLTVNGRTMSALTQPEGTTTATTVTLELPAGSTTQVSVTVREPRSNTPVEILQQPLVQALKVDLRRDTCR